jgi:hypothetical protein
LVPAKFAPAIDAPVKFAPTRSVLLVIEALLKSKLAQLGGQGRLKAYSGGGGVVGKSSQNIIAKNATKTTIMSRTNIISRSDLALPFLFSIVLPVIRPPQPDTIDT